MVLQMENACKKKKFRWKYSVSIFPSVIVAYTVMFFQLSKIYRQITVLPTEFFC
jgi:hypothetical protein